MANPTKKSQETGRKRFDPIKQNRCSWCGCLVTEFKSELSRNKYTISGLCPKCQNETFEE